MDTQEQLRRATGAYDISRLLESPASVYQRIGETELDRLLKAEKERRSIYDLASASPLSAAAEATIRLATGPFPDNSIMATALAATDARRYLLPPENDLIGFAQRAAREDLLTAAGLTSVRLTKLMAGMDQPWIRAGQADQSIAGFTQLQLMGGLLHQHQPYGRDVTAAFRANLGDFRRSVDMSPLAYVDPQARDDLYLARGFNPDLTDFTPAAFFEITSKAVAEEDEEDFAHNEAAYARLIRFEVRFERKDPWETCFKPVFRRLDGVRESLIRLFPIRNATAHSRIITLKDATLILYETSRILEAIHPFQK